MKFCGDCKRLRTPNCDRVWSIGMTAKSKDGSTRWLQNPTDWATNCFYYDEIDKPIHRLTHEKEQRLETLKYGGKIVWQ